MIIHLEIIGRRSSVSQPATHYDVSLMKPNSHHRQHSHIRYLIIVADFTVIDAAVKLVCRHSHRLSWCVLSNRIQIQLISVFLRSTPHHRTRNKQLDVHVLSQSDLKLSKTSHATGELVLFFHCMCNCLVTIACR